MKRIIVLGHQGPVWRVVLWAVVPAEQESFYAKPGATSQWPNASPAENAEIEAGRIAEKVVRHTFEDNRTAAQKRTEVEALWTNFQAAVNARTVAESTWDGTAWTAV